MEHVSSSLSDEAETEALMQPCSQYDGAEETPAQPRRKRKHLGFVPTAKLSFTFCILWFCANYFAIACLQFTTVASTTILTSTSSVWTLVIGAITRTENFTWRKLCGVMASLLGIFMISRVDLASKGPNTDGNAPRAIKPFPTKPTSELALGDFFALLSAIIYGMYTIALKRTSQKAAPLQLNMPLFFGLVGLINAFLLLPLFPIFNTTGIEKFKLPPNKRVWTILILNASSNLLSDLCWAYALVLTSPLVVTVGLSLTIPLSLVGEMIIQGRTEGFLYWIGAAIVVFSFIFVDREEVKEETKTEAKGVHVEAPVPEVFVISATNSARSSFADGLTLANLRSGEI